MKQRQTRWQFATIYIIHPMQDTCQRLMGIIATGLPLAAHARPIINLFNYGINNAD